MDVKLLFLVFSRLKLEIAQLNDDLTGLTFSCVAHVFKCNRLRLVAFLKRKVLGDLME
jgi:hypothetical protein